MTVPSPIFIAGHGRSGTTILGQLFEGVDGCKVLYERSAPELGWAYGGTGDQDPARIVPWLRKYAPHRVVDKEPRNVMRLSGLCEATGGTAIHILRDGRDVACSVQRGAVIREKPLEYWLDQRTSDQMTPGWRVQLGDAQKLKALPFRVAVGTFWAWMLSHALPSYSNSVLVVRYEDLLHDPVEVAEDIAAHTDVDPGQLVSNAVRLLTDNPHGHVAHASAPLHDAKGRTRRVGRWRNEFTETELAQLRYLAGAQYERLGYGWDR